MSNFTIRKAETTDVDALAACIDSAYSVYKDQVPDLPDVSDGLSDAIKSKSVWVAEIESSIVGGLILHTENDYLILENIAVHPKASGAGIGKALIKTTESECLSLGLKEIRLSTHKAMERNIGLYERLGWSIAGSEGNKIHMTKPSHRIKQ